MYAVFILKAYHEKHIQLDADLQTVVVKKRIYIHYSAQTKEAFQNIASAIVSMRGPIRNRGSPPRP